ncbi:serum paraoxonase/arylesterase 1-like [Octopus vulgaris]|nr:serum paraoxonase/lactonase 3 [Octopus sinensis]XP_036370497.1 serum paraoxonase/lactonase 3 [Octopus sinensis]CAI9718207.1 serum paraoxonase/arylesterase 1-like [Octopus vulgaris]
MYLKIVLISISALLLQHICGFIYQFCFKLTIYNHSPGPCKYIAGVENGSEDMHTLPNGLTFITSGFLVDYLSQGKNTNSMGRILLYDMSKDSNQEIIELELENFHPQRFVPHGISAWQDDNGKVTVFVVNHLVKGDQIESFEYLPEKKALRHVTSFKDGSMRNVNDVVATSNRTFYFTNWSHYRNFIGKLLEMLLLLPWTHVYYHDGEVYRLVAEDLVMANGIAMSNDEKFIYVACSMTKDIKVFKRDMDNRLVFHQEFMLDTLVDNISVDPEGNIWAGCHPRFLSILSYMENFTLGSPSQVLKLEVENGLIKSMKEVFSNDGFMLSGSTSASFYRNQTLIGSMLEKLVICDVLYM